ncbi:antibiotic biosynthesis monooxygenase family protein [Micromonospora sp. B11E3]|uniref:antibiotic biosynthesis monooxygenase family protein n=1 Tax=unclassified Micromonospora TaxID=2617518 RepID=UPI00325C7EFB
MSVVRMNVLKVPPDKRAEVERLYAERPRLVETVEGFEWFELLRPTDGTENYLVYTRWRTEADFERWFTDYLKRSHPTVFPEGEQSTPPPWRPQSLTTWSFDVAQQSQPSSAVDGASQHQS